MKKILSILFILVIFGAVSGEDKASAAKDRVPEVFSISNVSVEKLNY